MLLLYSMILDEILFNKRQEVTALKVRFKVAKIKKLVKKLPRPRDFKKAFVPGKLALIAELKKASPSAGLLRRNYQPAYLAKAYEEAGASALSVLTDEKYFRGALDHLAAAKETTVIPVLRKDFIIDESQIYESRIRGADAILLIVRILSDEQLAVFLELAKELKLACLVEAHNEKEVERVLKSKADIIGLNNRDLDTLKVDWQTTLRLLEKFPELKKKKVVAESGLDSGEQIKILRQKGVAGILVGEAILKSRDLGEKIKELLGGKA